MAIHSPRMIAIADLIERYITEHPQAAAADTADGIRIGWIGRQRYGDSLQDVQKALDYLVERAGVSRMTLSDGTSVYGRGRENREL